jgi:hypothetical protein
MSQVEPNPNGPPVVSDLQLVFIVYLLYLAAYTFGITALIGVIIAHTRFPDRGQFWAPIDILRAAVPLGIDFSVCTEQKYLS